MGQGRGSHWEEMVVVGMEVVVMGMMVGCVPTACGRGEEEMVVVVVVGGSGSREGDGGGCCRWWW